MWYGSYLSVVAMMVGFLSFRTAFQYSIHLSSYQDIYLEAHGSACIYFSSQGWQAHVFKKNLRPSNLSTSPCVPLFTPHCEISEGSECGRASTYLSLQGWQVHVFRGAFGQVHFSSSLHLLQKAVQVIGLVPISHCKGAACL